MLKYRNLCVPTSPQMVNLIPNRPVCSMALGFQAHTFAEYTLLTSTWVLRSSSVRQDSRSDFPVFYQNGHTVRFIINISRKPPKCQERPPDRFGTVPQHHTGAVLHTPRTSDRPLSLRSLASSRSSAHPYPVIRAEEPRIPHVEEFRVSGAGKNRLH